jgi:hypothetical protein
MQEMQATGSVNLIVPSSANFIIKNRVCRSNQFGANVAFGQVLLGIHSEGYEAN